MIKFFNFLALKSGLLYSTVYSGSILRAIARLIRTDIEPTPIHYVWLFIIYD